MRSFRYSSLLGLIALSLVACKSPSNEIPVGAYLSLSGPDSTFGSDTRDGIELAVEQTNATGLKGKKVRLFYEDDKSTPMEASNKVRQLIDRNKVVAVLGEVASSRSMAGGLVANTSKVPMVTPSSTAIDVTKNREFVFRTCFTDAQQGEVAARYVYENMKKTKVGILFAAQDTYSSGLAQSFRENFLKLGGAIVVEKGFQKGETNFTTYLEELKAKDPEMIYAPVYYNEMVQIARQAKHVGLAGSMFMGGDGWDSSNLIEGAGAELEGARFTNGYAPDVPWPKSKGFITAFQAKYHRAPNSLSAQGYDAAMVLFDAIQRSENGSPDSVRKALGETKDFAGATGNITIDKNRNAKKAIVVVAIHDNAFKFDSVITTQ